MSLSDTGGTPEACRDEVFSAAVSDESLVTRQSLFKILVPKSNKVGDVLELESQSDFYRSG